MRKGGMWRNRIGRTGWIPFQIDILLWIFLLLGWSLIFVAATWGLQRNPQQWLPLNLVAQVSADYSEDTTDVLKLARLDLEIIEAIKQDSRGTEQVGLTPTRSLVMLAATPTPTPRPVILAVNAGGPYEGDEGSPILLTAGGFNSLLRLVPGTVKYRWDLNDDGLYDDAGGALASVVFFDEGEYPVAVEATDLLGRVATDISTVSVKNVPPIVRAGQDLFADEVEEVSFAATAFDPGHDVLLYEWNFGDGSFPVWDTLHPVHTFEDNGSYIVNLRVQDNDGGVSMDNLVVHVGNLPPSVDAGPDRVAVEGQTITFRGKARDPSDLDTLTYRWDLDYDGRTFTVDALGSSVLTTYGDGPAPVVAALLVEDDDGGQTLDTVNVQVDNLPPTIINISNDGPVAEGSALTLVVEATDVAGDILTYAFDWDSDGEYDEAGPSTTASNVWYNQGYFPVGIRIDDGDQGQALTTTLITTYNVPPVAVANADSVRFEGDPVLFDASESSDPGLTDVLTYTWHFGDGSSENGKKVTHAFADNHVYSPTLTVVDDSGAVSTDLISVTILNANPVVDAGPDRIMDEGVLSELVGVATDPGAADTLTYAWDFSYDGFIFDEEATGSTANVTYLDGPAEINVALRVRDDDYNPFPTDGSQIGESIDAINVTVENVPPWNVSITAPPTEPYRTTTGLPVTFRGTGTDVAADSLTYRWDFNYDGLNFAADALGQVVSHTWQSVSKNQVALRVYDDDGDFTLSTRTVNVGGPPTAIAVITPTTIFEGQSVLLDGTGSSDPDGDSLIYTWNFGDGSPTSNAITVTHIYTDVGVFTATLRVDDGRGGVATDRAAVSVEDVPSIASMTVTPNPAVEGSPVIFDGSGSSAGRYDTLSYAWDFGDSSPVLGGVNVTHIYADDDVYTALLTVTDDDGTASITSTIVTVLNAIPIAEAGADQSGILEGTAVTFDGRASSDPGADALVLYEWDFDYDGSTFTVDKTGSIVDTSYPDGPAVYTVALRVTDDDGGVSLVDTVQVTVDNAPPSADSGGPYAGIVNTPVTFTATGSDVSADTLTYAWDLDNDATFEQAGQTVTHTWTVTGTYTVVLQVSDEDGGVSTSSTTVQINSLAPVAWLGTIYFLTYGNKAYLF